MTMIVKKIPILQGFPALDTVNYLSNVKNELSDYNPIFYDIETTGLSRYTAFCLSDRCSRLRRKISGCFISGWLKMKTKKLLFYRNLQYF